MASGVGIGAFLPKMGGNVVYFGGIFYVNCDRVRDPGNLCTVLFPFARPRPVARCLSCVLVVC